MIYSKGEPLKKVPTEQLVDELFAEIDRYYAAGKTSCATSARPPRRAAWLAETRRTPAMTPERLAALEGGGAQSEADGCGRARPARRGGLAVAGRRFTRA